MIDSVKSALITPIKAFRLRYLPLLMIYFAYGASGLSGIAESFWVKEKLSLGAVELVALGVWLSVPWTIKMVFGQMVDSIRILGSQRKIYVYFGAFLLALGNIMLIGLAGEYDFVKFASVETVYILASVISVIGFVIQDVVADAMSTEVVDRNRPEEEVQRDLAMVQVLGRLSLSIAMFVVAGIGGWLAEMYSYETMFTLALIVPFISVIGVTFIKLDEPRQSPINCKILCGGLGFAFFVILMGYNDVAYSQEIVFGVSLVVLIFMIKELISDIDEKTKRLIIFSAIIIFIYRAMPSTGPGVSWWEIDILGFDKAFFGTLAQIGTGIAIAGMWLLSDFITKKPVSYTLIMLTLIGTVLSLPVIGMYYGLHEFTQEHFGFGARTLALIDMALSSPFAHLSMIPLLTLIAIYAPAGKRATWFAVMAGLMNLALTAGALFTKYLNQFFTVSRELVKDGQVISHQDYSELGMLMIIVTAINLVVPLAVIYWLMIKRGSKENVSRHL